MDIRKKISFTAIWAFLYVFILLSGNSFGIILPSPTDIRAKSPWADVRAYGAKPNDAVDDTAAIQAAINASNNVYIPKGVYIVNPAVGLIVKTGLYLHGDGDNSTILSASTVAGSIIKRSWNPAGPNDYLQDVLVEKLAIVLNHPATAAPGNYVQIGFDFRNITRSTLSEVYVGNYNRGTLGKTNGSQPNMAQGYGIVFGNVSSSDPAYAGGEVNSVSRATVWGTRKGIVLDDATLSPLSAVHATLVENCDVQICEVGIANESRYTAGITFRDNIVQAIQNATGSANPLYPYRIDGYAGLLEGGYVEVAATVPHIVYLGSLSQRNTLRLGYYTLTATGVVSDNGTNNRIEYVDRSTGKLTTIFNTTQLNYVKAWVKFDSAGTVIASQNVQSVVRNGTGDFTVTWSKNFTTTNYPVTFAFTVDASANAGSAVIRSQTTSNLRLNTGQITSGSVVPFDFSVVYVQAFLD